MKNIEFIKTATKDYRVGAFTKSSKYTIEAVIKRIRLNASVIVEYGAGDGITTKKILEKLPNQGRLAAIEINEGFIEDLNKIKDHRLSVIKGDVVSLSKDFRKFGFSEAECVISSIPFTFLTAKEREEVIFNTKSNLGTNGQFIVFQYSPLIFPLLKKYFKKVKMYYEIRNLPPYFIMVAESTTAQQ